MKIRITKEGTVYQASLAGLPVPETPPSGLSEKGPAEAVVDLFWRLYRPSNREWLEVIDFTTKEIEWVYENRYTCPDCGTTWESENPFCPNPECRF